jgi:hypothetical protein
MTTCNQRGCAGEVFAKGLCGKHYAQERRGRLGQTPARAANGEGGAVFFRFPVSEKERLERVAKRQKTTSAELCRRAVRTLLGKLDPPEQGTLIAAARKR